jgi:hypothetical protein
MSHLLTLRGPGSTFRENACDVAGSGDALEGCHYQVSNDPAKTVHQGESISDKGGGDLNNEGLHLKRLQVI